VPEWMERGGQHSLPRPLAQSTRRYTVQYQARFGLNPALGRVRGLKIGAVEKSTLIRDRGQTGRVTTTTPTRAGHRRCRASSQLMTSQWKPITTAVSQYTGRSSKY